jgi:microsomal dipeptidase-like Zn-dependent dipeptidase
LTGINFNHLYTVAAYFSDLHCHTPLFSFNRLYPDTWFEWYFPIFPAQGDFCQLARGKVRVVMVSLYPIEQGFLKVRPLHLGSDNITDFLVKAIVDFPKQRVDEIQARDHEYFDDLMKELNFMQASALPVTHKVFVNPVMRKEFRYRIVSDFNDLKNLLNLSDDYTPGPACEDTIAVVLTIEGAHSLGVGQKNTLEMNTDELISKLSINIAKLKKLGPPGEEGAWCPFFISLDHHFWNQLGGHAVSLWKVIRKVLDQRKGINEEITEAGKFVVDALLDNQNGNRRILIDVAHMSIKVRKWYYDYIKQRGDNIPVIVSHTGVNGIETMDKAEMHGTPDSIHDVADELYERSEEHNPWDVFVSDEEIMIIHGSGGIMGLNLDQRISMGKKRLDETRKLARYKSAKVAGEIWIKPFVSQILHIAGHILKMTGQTEGIWDNISIGSDFNGMITPLKAFNTSAKFPGLQDMMFKELINRRASEVTLTGKTDVDIQEITDRIVWKNNLRFLEKNFR